ncbi:MAG: nuclear transport factor 2 family protein [Bacteroidota bacterium]
MRKAVLIFVVVFIGCSAKKSEEGAIRELLGKQQTAWNQGNVEEFMKGYWKSDSLMFIGSRITYGWDSTLARYHKAYPDRAAMGELTFTFYSFKFISDDACLVTGRFHLKRTVDEPTGMFTLLLRKKNGEWMIVYDHTS